MRAGRTARQLARIPVLLVLLRATGWYAESLTQAQMGVQRLQLGEVWGLWGIVSLISLAFVVVMLAGRRRWHPWAVLAIESVVAGALAFVPPLQWVVWFHISGWTTTMVAGFVQPLAMAWLGVVGLRAFHQLGGTRAVTSPSSDGGDAAPQPADKGSQGRSA